MWSGGTGPNHSHVTWCAETGHVSLVEEVRYAVLVWLNFFKHSRRTTSLVRHRMRVRRQRRRMTPSRACWPPLRADDTLLVWKLDRLGRDLRHLVHIVHDLTERGVGLKVLTGQGAAIDTTTASGKLVFGIFAALAEYERELISERTIAGLAAARARGRKGGRPFKWSDVRSPGSAPPAWLP